MCDECVYVCVYVKHAHGNGLHMCMCTCVACMMHEPMGTYRGNKDLLPCCHGHTRVCTCVSQGCCIGSWTYLGDDSSLSFITRWLKSEAMALN